MTELEKALLLRDKRNGKAFDLKKLASKNLLGKKDGISYWFYSDDGEFVYIAGVGDLFFCKLSLDYKGFGEIFELLRRNKDKEVKFKKGLAELMDNESSICHKTERVEPTGVKVETFLEKRKNTCWNYPTGQMAFLKNSEYVDVCISNGCLFVCDPVFCQYFAVYPESSVAAA